jgi:hypothetical protein
MARAALCVLGFSFSLGAQAQVFKCVDAAGKVVYSQSPCPAAAKSRTLAKPSAETAAVAPDAKADGKAGAKGGAAKPAETPADLDMEFRKRQQERADAEKKSGEQAAQDKAAQETCARAKQGLAQYAPGNRVSSFNDKGERYFLDDEQLAQERNRAQAAVTANCK